MNLSVQAGSSAVGRWVSALAVLYAPAIAATIVAVLIVLLVGRMISGPATAPTPAQQFTAADFRLGELQDRAAFNSVVFRVSERTELGVAPALDPIVGHRLTEHEGR